MADRHDIDRERGDYDTSGDWGRQGSWGSYGNRPNWGADRSDFGGARTGRTPLFGTGGGGFGTGFSSYGAGIGPYTGGLGAYGERGRFAGRGPKNWRRSDDRICEEINERLTDHPDIDASEIEVSVKDGEATLTGTVEDRHAKRLAEDIAESVSGIRDVHNQIRISTRQPNR